MSAGFTEIPVCDVPVVLPNGQRGTVIDGEIAVSYSLADVSDDYGIWCNGGHSLVIEDVVPEGRHWLEIMLDDESETVITIRSRDRDPIAMALLDAMGDADIDDQIRCYL